MYIVCCGCGVVVSVVEEGIDSFGSPYIIAISSNGRYFIKWVDPFFGGEPVWDHFGFSLKNIVAWKNKYL